MFHSFGRTAAGKISRPFCAHFFPFQLRQLFQSQPQKPSPQSILRTVQSHHYHRPQEWTGFGFQRLGVLEGAVELQG